MPVTQAAVDRLLARLAAIRPITSRKMFGGVGVYCNEVFFCVIDDDRLFFKAGPENLADYSPFDAPAWQIGPDVMPYREVPAAILESDDDLARFIDAAVAVALRKKQSKPKRKPQA